MKVAITGGTGFVGTRLVEKLHSQGEEIVIFTRNETRAKRIFPTSAYQNLEIVEYTPQKSGDWQNALSGCDAVVNLAGEPIAEERWTPQVKQKILQSRQLGTRKIVEAITQAEPKPSVLVNASAIGYYGTSETATFDENSPPGDDFLAEVCQTWEAEAEKVQAAGVRLVILRLGIVLGNGGALAKMLTPFKLYAGGPIGNGKQWFSWIHREDLVNLIITALKNPDIQGTFNATAPNPVRMNQLCQSLGEVMKRPSWLPVPGIALELLLGEGAKLVLEGQEVIPKQTQSTGFEYQYPTIKPALAQIVANY
ncbi:thylakoid membrane protein ThyD [Oscillatoria salina]|uniref:thylakoid membrane protein ThyD n=1 Tax=Oscillatoria salina TaxID=331517 RepID=UPI0013BD0A08|nr:TIGR01777 family oxidoreductase [Oscillatoria salina]MBZ8179308.1 TIGR01777 family protein [Oscillatoria salina IIICB1]NET86724.1 TIGR01777 family protein [Kamptonema sp. SIO1D9]